jgi:hypothetical protein
MKVITKKLKQQVFQLSTFLMRFCPKLNEFWILVFPQQNNTEYNSSSMEKNSKNLKLKI